MNTFKNFEKTRFILTAQKNLKNYVIFGVVNVSTPLKQAYYRFSFVIWSHLKLDR